MKADLLDVNDTRKTLTVEIPSDVVDRHIDHVAKDYSRKAKIPGFRPGKAPARVIKQRFREQILHDVAHDLVPRAIDDALREKGVEPVSSPDVTDVSVEEGRALTFTASFDTVPAFDPGAYETITIARPSGQIEDAAVEGALERLRERAAKFEPVEGRGVVDGDVVTADIERTDPSDGSKDSHKDVTLEVGHGSNPPGFDAHLLGKDIGALVSFSIPAPTSDPAVPSPGDVAYSVLIKDVKRRVLPPLDDEFAKDLGQFDSLGALRSRVRADLEHEARHAVERSIRADLMKQLAGRVPFEVPASLVEREVDRRLEEFASRLAEQQVDPRQAGIDWQAFREGQRAAAREAVAGALALDEVGRKEGLSIAEPEIEREIDRYAEMTGRTAAAVRAGLEKDGGLSRVHAGLRREKAIDFVMARATITSN